LDRRLGAPHGLLARDTTIVVWVEPDRKQTNLTKDKYANKKIARGNINGRCSGRREQRKRPNNSHNR
jgi:hypothetical protein